MCVWMYVHSYVRMCTYIHMYACVHTYVYVRIAVSLHVYTCNGESICVDGSLYAYSVHMLMTCVCMYVCMYRRGVLVWLLPLTLCFDLCRICCVCPNLVD